MNSEISIRSDQGRGRPFLLLYEDQLYRELSVRVHESLVSRTRALLCEVPALTDLNWKGYTEKLLEILRERSFRQVSLLGFGAASTLVQNLCLADPRLVRSVVLVDASTRPHPSRFLRLVDRIERAIPLGLPLRSITKGFDGRSFMQRIRCPVLIVTTHRVSAYLEEQAELLERYLPTAWRVKLQQEHEIETFSQLVLDFQRVPARCPQKNIARETTVTLEQNLATPELP